MSAGTGFHRSVAALCLGTLALFAGACTTSRSTDFRRDQMVGVVYGDDGYPVAGAEIRVGITRRAVSDSFGRFRVSSVPAGRHTVQVRAPGFETAREEIDFQNRTQLVRVDLVSLNALTDAAIRALERRHLDQARRIGRRMYAIDPEDIRTRLVLEILRDHPEGGER